jgi:hypothetical protein
MAFAGIVIMESSVYHVLFGEGVGGQPTAFLEAVNSRHVTVLALTVAFAFTIATMTKPCCGTSCFAPYWALRWVASGYAAAAGAIAAVSPYDRLVRDMGADPGVAYVAFDFVGILVGIITIIAAAFAGPVYSHKDGDGKV